MAEQTATAKRRRPQLTIERLVERAERFSEMSGLTPMAAVKKAMPDELLAIPMEDLRVLVEASLVQRLAQRRSRSRYRETERQAEQIQAMTAQVLAQMNEIVRKKAEVLVRVRYSFQGASMPLLNLPLDAHIAKRAEAQRTAKTHSARFEFHEKVIIKLRKAKVDSISALSMKDIETLAEAAGSVWGQS